MALLKEDTPSTRVDLHDVIHGFILVEGEYFVVECDFSTNIVRYLFRWIIIGDLIVALIKKDTPSTEVDLRDVTHGFIVVEGEYFYR